ncbi:MAG: hypothetical protein JJT94_16945 [Bernardetiaceae bacterium]|nr:hypothetical protein [Bernardetiaceae bacterium]
MILTKNIIFGIAREIADSIVAVALIAIYACGVAAQVVDTVKAIVE